MKLISKLTGVFNRWRQRVDEIQYHDGYHWAKDVYFRGDLSFQALLDAATPVTCAFERGVMQAVIDIERDNNPEPEVNEAGEPVGVPFFIHPSNLPPPKSEEEKLYYVDPDLEAIETLRRRREQGLPIIRQIGVRGWKQEGFSIRRRLGWTKVKGNA